MGVLKIGDVCGIWDKGKRIDCVIASTRQVQRGRQAGEVEYALAPIESKRYRVCYVVGHFQLGLPSKRHTAQQIQAAIIKANGVSRDRIQV